MSIPQKLKKHREVHHLTQKELAARMGIAREYYAHIKEGDRRPSVHSLNNIATLLDIPIVIALPFSDPGTQDLVNDSNNR